jgi:hypothetical protein
MDCSFTESQEGFVDREDLNDSSLKDGSKHHDEDAENVLHQTVEDLVTTKRKLNSGIKHLCAQTDSFNKISTEIGKDARRLDREINLLPNLEDWIQLKVSTLQQMKAQLLFLHKTMDEE